MTLQRDGIVLRSGLFISWRELVRLPVSCTYLEEGYRIPRWYGIAYRDFQADRYVCFPLGVNVIVHYGRRVLHWLKVKRKPSAIDEAFYAGYKHGRWGHEEFGA